ncbi:MAG: type II secretion system GspH family protein [Endomicrobia bacterium]|nr:type II secretion system GspH family protein [Endomicrobiia bacterium]
MNSKGFTLIEVLVTSSVILMLSLVFLTLMTSRILSLKEEKELQNAYKITDSLINTLKNKNINYQDAPIHRQNNYYVFTTSKCDIKNCDFYCLSGLDNIETNELGGVELTKENYSILQGCDEIYLRGWGINGFSDLNIEATAIKINKNKSFEENLNIKKQVPFVLRFTRRSL